MEQMKKARGHLPKMEIEADQFRVNKCYEKENYKNKTIHFEQQRASNQVRQLVFHWALQGVLGTLNSCNELHFQST
jgi:F-type H+-transporting ATPase subunit b